VGGIVAQIQDRETGYLVASVEECAEAVLAILEDPIEARAMALRGKEYVRRNFLTPRLLRDWLALFNELDGNGEAVSELVTALRSG
jgi:trehalose synthase